MTPAFIQEVFAKATLLHSHDEIMQAFDHMAENMQAELADKNPVLLTVMHGGLMTASELSKRLNFPLQMDYVHATRYRGATKGGASVHWIHEPALASIRNRYVVIVDDILDGGITLSAIIEYCMGNGAEKVYTAVLLDKTEARDPEGWAKADFTGIETENFYVFGFGLDYHDYLRNIPAIYKVSSEHML